MSTLVGILLGVVVGLVAFIAGVAVFAMLR